MTITFRECGTRELPESMQAAFVDMYMLTRFQDENRRIITIQKERRLENTQQKVQKNHYFLLTSFASTLLLCYGLANNKIPPEKLCTMLGFN